MIAFGPAVDRHGYALGKAHGRCLVVAAIIGSLVVGAVVIDTSRRVMSSFGSSKVQITRLTVNRYAAEAFPQWAAAHPERTCPDHLNELNAWVGLRDTRDPYGVDYRWTCQPTSRGVVMTVWSIGEDGAGGTADDVWSDDARPHLWWLE